MQPRKTMGHTVSSRAHARRREPLLQSTMRIAGTDTVDSSTSDSIDEPVHVEQRVFETTELLEHIISFLPMEKIFTLQRISKQWKNTINASPDVQEKMFLRLGNKPKQVCEPHVVGWTSMDRYVLWNVRVPSCFTLVTLNPELRHDEECHTRRFGQTCIGHGRNVKLQWGPAPIRQHFSLLDTFISDPPCQRAEVSLTVSFQDGASTFPITIAVENVTVSSETGLIFQDILRLALNARRWSCTDKVPGSVSYLISSEASLREAIDRLPEYTTIPGLLECPLMEVKLTLLDDVAAPTPEERAAIASGLRYESTPR